MLDNDLPIGFIREFQDKFNWSLVTKKCYLYDDFIREFHDKIDWTIIPRLSIIIRKHYPRIS